MHSIKNDRSDVSTSKPDQMKDLHDRARETLNLLAQLAQQQAANEENPAATRFRNHRMMDLYKDAETSMDSAAELLQQEPPGT